MGERAIVFAGPALPGKRRSVDHAGRSTRPGRGERWPRRDQLVGVPVAAEPQPHGWPCAEYQSPAMVGSPAQSVGPSVPGWMMPPHPAAMTWNRRLPTSLRADDRAVGARRARRCRAPLRRPPVGFADGVVLPRRLV